MDLDIWHVAARLALACLLGGVIGIERDVKGHEAGLRTHMLLSLARRCSRSCPWPAFDEFIESDARTVQVDPSRIASYVAAGVGFIGGGAIVKHRGDVT
ncbi:MAG: MgtC/SapB family protein, partial [Ilumatobacter sp.]